MLGHATVEPLARLVPPPDREVDTLDTIGGSVRKGGMETGEDEYRPDGQLLELRA